MKAKKRFLSLLLCGAMLFSLCPQAAFAEGAEAGGLCEHHPQHTAECGYTEGSEGTPCTHEHTGDCYTLVTECVHEHGPECYPEESAETAEAESVSGNTATPSEPEEQEPTACSHECSEESGCITKELDCQHEHDETCGYAPATEGTPCTYVCEVCNPQDSGETEETEPEAECICTERCTEETVNAECPVCGAEGADLTACEGMEAEIATLSNALAADSKADTGVFTVTGGTLGTDYTYTAPNEYDPDGGEVLTIKGSATLTISTNSESGTSSGCRIVISDNVTANITLAGVNITPADAGTNDGYSGIDLGSGATLDITLQSGSSNVINGGKSSTAGTPAPGIHVPEGSTLTITGNGSLEVNGAYDDTNAPAVGIGGMGSSSDAGGACGNVLILGGTIAVHGGTSSTRSSVDIGGGASDTGKGGGCNTVIILTSVNNGESLTIGGGKGLSSNNGSDGAGIKPTGNGNYTVYGDLEFPCDITIPEGATVVIPEGASLTVPESVELTNNGTIQKQDGGSFINDGTVTGQQPADDRYTINYAEETITIGEGYEVYTSATDGTQIQSGGSITAYIGESLYLQKTDSETTGRTAISIPDRPEAPETNNINISYSDEKLTIAPDAGFSANNLEYTKQLSQSDQEWAAVPESFLLSEMGWAGSQMNLYFRIKATETSFASAATTTGKEIPSRPAAPTNAGTVTNQTQNTIMIGSENGQEYRCGTGGTWGDWQTDSDGSITFKNLSPGTEYTIQNRYQSGQNETTGQEHFASFTNSTTSVTLPSITTTSLETGYVGVEYSAQLEAVVAEGTNVTWSLENSSLPAGLTLNGNGTISGTPTTAGQFSVTVKVAIFGELGQERAGTMGQLSIIISKSDAELGGLEVSGQTGFQGHFQYGDVITVTFTPERKENNSTNALAENTAALTYTPAEGAAVELATATAQSDGSFKLTYDTKEKKLPIGENLSLTVSYGGSGEFNPVEETVTLSLDKAILKNMPTVTGSFVYGGTLTLNYTPQDDEEVTYQWWRIIDDSSTERIDGATGETYTLTESEIGGSIYIIVSATDEWHRGAKQSDQYQISKAPGSIVIACDSVTYGETVQPSVTNNTNTGADVTYSYAGTGSTSYGPSNEAPTNAGTYTVTATVAETATHTSAESEPVAFTISKASLTAPQNLNLTSTAPGKATATWEEVQNASGYTVQLYKDGEADGDPIITTGTSYEFSIAEAGSYTVKVKANGDSNHTDSTEAESNSLTFYTVTVNGSYAQTGGTDVYIEGATVSIDAGTRAGYTFDGWTSSDGVTFANAGSAQTTFIMPGKSVTVTASWVPNSSEVGDQEFVRYIVEHYKQNTDGSYRLDDAEYPIGEVGDTVTATARNYEGYTYNAEKSNASGKLTEIKSDADIVTLKLYYDLTVYTVTVETDGNGNASASPASATMGQTVTLTANAAGGYHFVRWEVVSGDITLNGNTFTMSAGNVTVRAVFERTSSGGGGGGTSYDYYTISATAGEGGSISPSGNISVREGRDKTFTIIPADGYVISDVRVDGVSVGAVSSYTFDNVQKRHTIEAFFAKENPDTGNPFTDVHPDDWFYNDVVFVYQNGLMNGTSATTFSPNDPITRAQVAVIFYRMAGSPEVTGDSAFTDVENGPGTAWYYNAVLWAQQNGIVSGYGDGTYHPEKNITREQLAVIFYNFAKLKGYDVSATNDLSGFTDAGDVSDWALPAMRWAVGSGIMGGYGDGILDPQGTATRAQVAAMLCRFIENNKLVPPTAAPEGDSGTTGTGGTGNGGGGWTQQKPVPQTGDNSNIGLWTSLMLLSLSGIVVLLVTEKVRRRRMEAEEAPDPLTI